MALKTGQSEATKYLRLGQRFAKYDNNTELKCNDSDCSIFMGKNAPVKLQTYIKLKICGKF